MDQSGWTRDALIPGLRLMSLDSLAWMEALKSPAPLHVCLHSLRPMSFFLGHVKPARILYGLLKKAGPCRYVSTTPCDPLRILFCGSEEFSIASLRALHNEYVEHPETIASIDVACRPGKRVGRGLKRVREGKISLLCGDWTSADGTPSPHQIRGPAIGTARP